MPWSNQGGSGGPWGGGSGGGGGPWGQRPGGGGGAPTPPNIEDMIRRGQERIRNLLPGGLSGGRGLALIALAFVAVWLVSGIYKVEPDEQGVVLTFGKWNGTTTGPGLHYWWPSPIGERMTPKVTIVNRSDVGFADTRRGGNVDVPEESLMLTGDQNIADVDFTVQWVIGNAGEFLFNIRNPEGTVKVVAESAMREIVGQTTLTTLLTGGRNQVEADARDLLQKILDDYGAGVAVQRIQLLQVDPPTQVIDSFNEVQRARQDKTRLRNQAEAYENRIVPTARGEAASVVEQATAFKERVTKEADGEAQQFLAIYESYAAAKDVTRRRLYLETMRDVLANANKVIIDQDTSGGDVQGVIPFLPLNDLARKAAGEAQ
ncbi:MAG: FtsH protease activity modulator HflK [Alphaproteobacteria bacterium]